ncbi:CocE/NonD family hydrolase [Caulobacter sp. KR2-114]|uniref:CocE/NonD family hydrolase n=1 Tax=Caulobacter sp. KR2-114 TaxID=3400912 RepID=UPI003C099B28
MSDESGRQAAAFENWSEYVAMRDGVRLAISMTTPPKVSGWDRLPAVVIFTRYGRATRAAIASATFSESLELTRHGFIVVQVDVRGTGASFGARTVEKGWAEADDYREVLDWIVAQPWSDGRVVATGISYPGNACDLLQVHDHPALVAVAPRFTDFDIYEHLLFPGGMPDIAFSVAWSQFTAALDRGGEAGQPPADDIPPQAVDGDDGALYRAALAEHGANADQAARFKATTFRGPSTRRPDDPAAPDRAVNLCDVAAELAAGARPAFHWASWMDAGTAAGALARFRTLSGAPMRLKIGAWTHGAMHDANPFGPSHGAPPVPGRAEQAAELAGFFQAELEGRGLDTAAGGPARRIDYLLMAPDVPGGGEWRTSGTWPPAGVRDGVWRFSAGGVLVAADVGATLPAGVDAHAVDPEDTTGPFNRWTTQLGLHIAYPDRAEADAALLTYTSAPLAAPLTIVGEGLVTLHVETDATDGLFIAYLEAVGPDGRVIYLSEGGLRGLHRQVSAEPPIYVRPGPNRSFREADAAPMVPGELTELTFPLLPTAVRLPAGWRLRLALAGADKHTFAAIPDGTAPTWRLHRGGTRMSGVVLPVIW